MPIRGGACCQSRHGIQVEKVQSRGRTAQLDLADDEAGRGYGRRRAAGGRGVDLSGRGEQPFFCARAACQENLHQLGSALAKYSEANGGYFPAVPSQGKLATAGIYAPVLMQNGLITDVSRLVCPDSALAERRNSFRIPTYSELELAPSSKVVDLRPTLGGSYGYNLGYTRDGSYYPTRSLSR